MRSSENVLRKDKEQKHRKRSRGYVEDVFATKTPRRAFAADRNRSMTLAKGSIKCLSDQLRLVPGDQIVYDS